jgi:N-methylhydantoinase B/oxoprolinase/acetone carboxylase alpha subunit
MTDGQFTCEGDRHNEAPQGFFNGHDGAGGAIIKNPGQSDEASWPSKISGASTKSGDVIRIVTPNGGGYYDPFDRDPQAVVDDVLDGFADVNTVETVFGVAIDRSTMTVDIEGTEKLRKDRSKPAVKAKPVLVGAGAPTH